MSRSMEEYKIEMEINALMNRWKELSALKTKVHFSFFNEESERENELIKIDNEIEEIRELVFFLQQKLENGVKSEAAAFVVGLIMILCIIGFFVLLVYVAIS